MEYLICEIFRSLLWGTWLTVEYLDIRIILVLNLTQEICLWHLLLLTLSQDAFRWLLLGRQNLYSNIFLLFLLFAAFILILEWLCTCFSFKELWILWTLKDGLPLQVELLWLCVALSMSLIRPMLPSVHRLVTSCILWWMRCLIFRARRGLYPLGGLSSITCEWPLSIATQHSLTSSLVLSACLSLSLEWESSCSRHHATSPVGIFINEVVPHNLCLRYRRYLGWLGFRLIVSLAHLCDQPLLLHILFLFLFFKYSNSDC